MEANCSATLTLDSYQIEKWSDVNHLCRALASCLHSAKTKVKGLALAVIGYMQKCFTNCIKQNETLPFLGLLAIVPHAFGEHEKCKEWCWYNENPVNYCQLLALSREKELKGADLCSSIEGALKPFLTEEAAKKLVPVGSSQHYKCIDSVFSSKTQKVRY